MEILQNYDLTEHSTFGLPAKAAYFATAYTREDVKKAYDYSQKNNIQILPIGKGSNIIFGREFINKFLLEIDITGFQINKTGLLTVGAGKIWDDVVSRCVDMNLAGIECLSAIPGTVGATPVQNVGAYGQEISDTFVKLTAFDLDDEKFTELNPKQCGFGYRDSIFKNQARKKYIITDITLQLISNGSPTLTYQSLAKHLAENGLTNPSLQQVREAVIAIRRIKLPDPSIISNAGSFFKNPVVDKKTAASLLQKYPDMPTFNVSRNLMIFNVIKLSGGWLIEQCGLKGYRNGHFGTHDKNALVLVHYGGGTIDELYEFVQFIKNKVKSKFGIELHQEPETIM